jgi:tetratricopeptide (TPR) repeat protein
MYGNTDKVVEAATFILQHPGATDASRSLAAHLLGSSDDVEDRETRGICHNRIHVLRKTLRRDPRNAIAWANTSLYYAKIGQLRKSVDAMRNALRISPNNRFILRSAARLHCHCGRPDIAHDLLVNADATQFDPWLLAAEIATASAMNEVGSMIADGRNALRSGRFSALNTAELASALGMVELADGDTRAGKKLLRRSLQDPTDNAVAQARWASRDIDLEVDQVQLATPRSFEARAWNFYHRGLWSDSLRESVNWLNDESFSKSPAVMGSFIASVVMEDFDQSAEIARFGLIANPGDLTLKNNLIYSLVNQGKLDDAEDELNAIHARGIQSSDLVALTATEGLIRYRRGDTSAGRDLYMEAVRHANASAITNYRAFAAIFLALEDLHADSPSVEATYELAIAAVKGVSDQAVNLAFRRLQEAFSRRDSKLNRTSETLARQPQ